MSSLLLFSTQSDAEKASKGAEGKWKGGRLVVLILFVLCFGSLLSRYLPPGLKQENDPHGKGYKAQFISQTNEEMVTI